VGVCASPKALSKDTLKEHKSISIGERETKRRKDIEEEKLLIFSEAYTLAGAHHGINTFQYTLL